MRPDVAGHLEITPPLGLLREQVAKEGELWGHWLPCREGCCLVCTGDGTPGEMADSLRDLVSLFLRPNGHRLDGMVCCGRPDDGQVFTVSVTRNRVTHKTLRRADPDRPRHRPWRPSTGSSGGAQVIPLQRRR